MMDMVAEVVQLLLAAFVNTDFSDGNDLPDPTKPLHPWDPRSHFVGERKASVATASSTDLWVGDL